MRGGHLPLVLLAGEYDAGEAVRLISGSILSGRAPEVETAAYLTRYARQVTIIKEDREQIPLGWVRHAVLRLLFIPDTHTTSLVPI